MVVAILCIFHVDLICLHVLKDAVDLASKGFVPSPLGKGNVKAGNRITIYVGAGTWKKPAKALSENIELVLHKDAIIK